MNNRLNFIFQIRKNNLYFLIVSNTGRLISMHTVGKVFKNQTQLYESYLVPILQNMQAILAKYKGYMIYIYIYGIMSSANLLFLCNYLTSIEIQYLGVSFLCKTRRC